MPVRTDIYSFFEKLSLRISLIKRLAIGNSAIIILGAIVGTLLTRHLTDQAADIWLILFFSAAGTFLSILLNLWIIKTALKPFYDLRAKVNKEQFGSGEIEPYHISLPDEDVYHVVEALNTLIKQLREQNRQLKAISEQAINAQEDERKRIAQSLHDDTGQALSSLIISIDRINSQFTQDVNPEILNQLKSARTLAQSALSELRKIIYGLRPTLLDDLGLVPAIRWYARTILDEAGIRTSISAPVEDEKLPAQLTLTLFRISQEAINNILRHSKAQNASISIAQNNGEITLEIFDDGIGFNNQDVTKQAVSQQQWGLLGIQERVELIRGKLEVVSIPGKGTRIIVNAPFNSEG